MSAPSRVRFWRSRRALRYTLGHAAATTRRRAFRTDSAEAGQRCKNSQSRADLLTFVRRGGGRQRPARPGAQTRVRRRNDIGNCGSLDDERRGACARCPAIKTRALHFNECGLLAPLSRAAESPAAGFEFTVEMRKRQFWAKADSTWPLARSESLSLGGGFRIRERRRSAKDNQRT